MTTTPKMISRERLQELYVDHQCATRLNGCKTEVLDRKTYTSEEVEITGITEYRFECRKSDDGTCVLLVDLFIRKDGEIETVIVDLEIDGQEFYPESNTPHPLR